MKVQQIVLITGVFLIMVGAFGSFMGAKNDAPAQAPSGSGKSLLEVKDAKGLTAPTANKLQGSASLQNQGTKPQGTNTGASLQPNAGVNSLPDNY